MKRRIAASIAALTLTLGGFTLFSAQPASADATSCINYLISIGAHNITRDAICQATELRRQIYSAEVALNFCRTEMTTTALPGPQAEEACTRAVAP